MITSRCNLDCDYCVLEDSKSQIAAELTLANKLDLIDHMYHVLRFRRITFSGGEVLVAGGSARREFLAILRHLKQYTQLEGDRRLEVRMYTNAILLNQEIAQAMAGVVSLVAINVDSADNSTLQRFGRVGIRQQPYLDQVAAAMRLLAAQKIPIKLHSVVGRLNHLQLAEEVSTIFNRVRQTDVEVKKWKFYQYMSYDDEERDERHRISKEEFTQFEQKVQESEVMALVPCHFKSNLEMDSSLFNVLHYGNAQYRLDGDTWTTTRRTEDLRSYTSIEDLIERTGLNQSLFEKHHRMSA